MADADAQGDREESPDSEVLRRLCHELRQPLVVAMGYVSMLEEGAFGHLSPQAAPILRTVAERLDALSAIIDRAVPTGPSTG